MLFLLLKFSNKKSNRTIVQYKPGCYSKRILVGARFAIVEGIEGNLLLGDGLQVFWLQQDRFLLLFGSQIKLHQPTSKTIVKAFYDSCLPVEFQLALYADHADVLPRQEARLVHLCIEESENVIQAVQ